MVRELIYGDIDPYSDLSFVEGRRLDLQGWNSDSPVFRSVIQKVEPDLIIEVGTWKGASAINMSEISKEINHNDVEIICVDTFLGSSEHWFDNYKKLSLNINLGYPSLFHQFMTNVVLTESTDTITPFPIDSFSGADFLKSVEVNADIVYVDAAHDYESTYLNIKKYWPLIRSGGVMIGDDLVGWPGVEEAVNKFAEENSLEIHAFREKWVFNKS